MIWLWGILLVAGSYFIGNLDFAYIIVKLARNDDIRNYGSGNAGTTNVLRTMGLKYALPVFALDALKGALVIFIAQLMCSNLGMNSYWIAFAGMAVICGHNWPLLLNYRGGKGSATSIGLFLAYDWRVALICIAIGLIFLAFFRMMSLTSIVGMISLPITVLFFYGWIFSPELLLALFLACSTVFQHRSNIKRIAAGTESKVGQKVDMKK
ncbi:MAG: glycerol-3-phosphate 1-O-acyltransferase PlsY [Eubacteriaceae bacterium]|nr:glycerol-3-phosphate 1-O-acyltransferase PlsY [Eubacteriaceae bacterium]